MILDVLLGDGDDSEIDAMSDEEEDLNNKSATECLKRKKELLELMTEWGEEEDADMENMGVEDDGNANEYEPEITMEEVVVKDDCFQVNKMVVGNDRPSAFQDVNEMVVESESVVQEVVEGVVANKCDYEGAENPEPENNRQESRPISKFKDKGKPETSKINTNSPKYKKDSKSKTRPRPKKCNKKKKLLKEIGKGAHL